MLRIASVVPAVALMLLASAAVASEKSPSSAHLPLPQAPHGWAMVGLNGDTAAGSGVALQFGAQWFIAPLGPGGITIGPAFDLSRQEDRRSGFPCRRRVREDIIGADLDARYVLPVSKTLRPFVRTGPGLHHFSYRYHDRDCFDATDSTLALGWMLGLGLEADLKPGLTLHASLDTHGSDDDWVTIGAGISIPF